MTMALDLWVLYFTVFVMLTVRSEGWDWTTAFSPYGDIHRKHRSYQQRFISSPEILNYLDVQLSETRKMLKAILDDTEDYGTYVQRYGIFLISIHGLTLLMLCKLLVFPVLSF